MNDFISFQHNECVDIRIGDSRTILRDIPADTFHACITSPPYYSLRNYDHDSQIGRESTPDAYISELVKVFSEVKRVLRNDGTCWINIGDSYASSPPGNTRGVSDRSGLCGGKLSNEYRERLMNGHATKMDTSRIPGIPKKSLLLIPSRLMLALQADGWIVRQDIIWEKPSGCESVKDRPSLSHEHLLMLTKSPKYYFNAAAIREPTGANCRSVWKISTVPFKGAHFATMPPKLVERCLLASTPAEGNVLDPFGGAGTTGLVARKHGRQATLIELNPAYVEIAQQRLSVA